MTDKTPSGMDEWFPPFRGTASDGEPVDHESTDSGSIDNGSVSAFPHPHARE